MAVWRYKPRLELKLEVRRSVELPSLLMFIGPSAVISNGDYDSGENSLYRESV